MVWHSSRFALASPFSQPTTQDFSWKARFPLFGSVGSEKVRAVTHLPRPSASNSLLST